MTVKQTRIGGDNGNYDEWTVYSYETHAAQYNGSPHTTRIQVEYEVIWMGNQDNVRGSRLTPKEIDELVTVLLYAKKVIEDHNGD